MRVLVEPPADYTRMQLTIYPQMVVADEEIRIIAGPEGSWPADVPQHDYWLFDDHTVWCLTCGDGFRVVGAELLEDEDAMADHLQWRDTALAQSVLVDDCLATRPPAD